MERDGQNASAVPAREETDDHDLLTYGEAGVRLRQEVEAQRALVAELKIQGAAEQQVVRARERLAALEEAYERNRRQPINDENFEKFFGYQGKARRNT